MMMNFPFEVACMGAFALCTVVFLLWKVFSPKQQGKQQQQEPCTPTHFDLDKYKVTDKPNMWMFDDLLSKEFLDYIDQQFETLDLPVHHEKLHTYEKHTRSLALPLDEKTVEFTNLLEKLGHFVPTEACPMLVISEVWGDDQGAHLDHVEVDNLAPLYQNLQFLDREKQRQHPDNQGRIVPTLSMVTYFNDEGSIVFPKLDMELEGKRGRIFMWQNYHDEKRPEANPLSTHYGKYSHTRCKRVMACGVLSNETPDPTQPATTKGVLYCPNACGHHAHHDDSMQQLYNNNQLVFVKDDGQARCMYKEVMVTKSTWDEVKWSYELTPTKNLVNHYLGVSDVVETLTQKQMEAKTTRSCGCGHEEVCVYFLLVRQLGLEPAEACGWICACHLCNYSYTSTDVQGARLRKQVAQHENTIQVWEEVGVFDHHHS